MKTEFLAKAKENLTAAQVCFDKRSARTYSLAFFVHSALSVRLQVQHFLEKCKLLSGQNEGYPNINEILRMHIERHKRSQC